MRKKTKAKKATAKQAPQLEVGGVLRQEMKQINKNVSALIGAIASIEIKVGVIDGSTEKTDFKTPPQSKGIFDEAVLTRTRLEDAIKCIQRIDSRLKKTLG